MKTYKVNLTIRAECESDAEELLNDYTGQETHIDILKVCEEPEEKDYQVIYKFSDVIRTIKATSPEEADRIANSELENISGDDHPISDTNCYDIEIDVVEEWKSKTS